MDRYGHRSFADFRIVYTFGTPFKGSSAASITQLASSNSQLRVLQPVKVNDLLQLLGSSTNDLLAKRRDRLCPPILLLAGYETQPVNPIGIIVDKDSATYGTEVSQSRAFDKDHINLVKPSTATDPVYKWVRDGIESCVHNTEQCPDPKDIPKTCDGKDFGR